MLKWIAYIVLLLIFAPCLSSAKNNDTHFNAVANAAWIHMRAAKPLLTDTVPSKNKKPERDDKKKIKEIAKAKQQPKPEKLGNVDEPAPPPPKPKPKRQRRPEGLERPPEIPRRNGN